MLSDGAPTSLFGTMLIGLVISSLFGGVALIQVVTFMKNSKGDHIGQKLMVWTLWFLDTLHISLMCHLVYHYLVIQPTEKSLVWSFPAHMLIQFIIMPVAHWLYIVRIWKITTRKHIPMMLTLLVFANLVAGVFVAVKLFQCPSLEQARDVPGKVAVAFVLAVTPCIDFLIAATLWCALSRAGTNLRWTNSSSTMLLAYFVNTGAIVSVFSLSVLITFAASQHTLAFVALDAITTRLHVNSFLGMVNARHYFQLPKPSMTLDFHSDTASQHLSVDKSTRRVSKTINEVGLPLFQPSMKSDDIKMVEVMVKQEALSSEL